MKIAGFLLALLLVCAPTAAQAQADLRDPLARELKAAGDKAIDLLRYEDALRDYERAAAIESHPSLHFNRARALQALHRYPEALDQFEEFKRQAPPELLAQAGQLDELIASLRQQVSTLTLKCNVKGATVLVRGMKAGMTPLDGPLRLNAGAAVVSVVAEGQRPYAQELLLPGGGASELMIRLEPRKPPGRVTVRSPAPGAFVFVDGVRLGVVPAETALPAGRHRLRVEHPDFRRAETTFELADGENKLLTVGLERKPGLLQKWWFWTACGVAVAGGAAAVVALTTESKPARGDIAPGVISTPLLRY